MTTINLKYTPVALHELDRLAASDAYAVACIQCAVIGAGLLGERQDSLLLDSPLIPVNDGYEFFAKSRKEPFSRYCVQVDSSCKHVRLVTRQPEAGSPEKQYFPMTYPSPGVKIELHYPAGVREHLAGLSGTRVSYIRKKQAKVHSEFICSALPGETPGALKIEKVSRPVDPQTHWTISYVSSATGSQYYCMLSNDGVEVVSLHRVIPTRCDFNPLVWWDGKPGSYARPA